MKITNKRFSIRFCTVASNYGFTTIAKFEKFLGSVASPSIKLWVGRNTWVRAAYLSKELEAFKNSNVS